MSTNKHETRAETRKATLAPLKLSVLMQRLPKAQWLAIMAECGNAESTWWNWKRSPRIIPGGALLVILNHLSTIHGRDITIQEAYQPVV